MRKGICKKGHLIEGDNIYKRNDGFQQCRICTIERANKRRSNPELYKYDLAKQRESYNKNKEERKRINRERWIKNKEQYNKKQKEIYPQKLLQLKTQVLTHYGNGKLSCVCCGINIIQFLTLDHINGRPNEPRGRDPKKKSGQVLWSFLRKRNYPKGYQTLCWNCNSGRQVNKGICPHKTFPQV